MPVVTFHLVEGHFSDDQAEELLIRSAELYGKVLEAPMERIRAFITTHSPQHFFVGGKTVSKNDVHAPFFEFIVLDGRSLEQRHELLSGFTDIISEVIGVDKSVIRGFCRRVTPEEWGIGGTPASVLRQAEIEARKAAAVANKAAP